MLHGFLKYKFIEFFLYMYMLSGVNQFTSDHE